MQGVRRGGTRRAWLLGLAVLAVVAALVAGLGATGRLPVDAFDDAAPTPTPAPTASPTPPPAAPVLRATPPPASPAAALPTGALQRLLAAPALRSPGAVVLDGATGEVLLDRGAAGPRTPASVSKLATGAAVLVAAGPDTRFTTRVVSGPAPGELTLVGGGDPTLVVGRPRAGAFPRPASLAELAAATAATLRVQGTSAVTVRIDDGLFSGPSVSPDWRSGYVPGGVVSPVAALAVNAGRVRPGASQRAADPALAAGAEFVRLLSRRGVEVRAAVVRAAAAGGVTELARVQSPTVAELVEQMLATSDNDLAEVLFRQVALARGRPGTFVDGQAEVAAILDEIGVPTEGMRLLDGSGLARDSRVSPETVARLLLEASSAGSPALRPLLTGLPVARFSGTLDDRFDEAGAGVGAGAVRAKTGTLTGVDTLAGLATGAGGRLLVFAVLADQVRPADGLRAQDGLDRFAAALAVAADGNSGAGGRG